MSWCGSGEQGGTYRRCPLRGNPTCELYVLGVGGTHEEGMSEHAPSCVSARSQVISRITTSGSKPRVCGGHAAPSPGPVLDPDLGSLGLSLSPSLSSSVPTGRKASDEVIACPVRLFRHVSRDAVRSVGACDPDDVINEFVEWLAVDALSSSFLYKRTVKSNELALPVSYQRPSSSSSSGPTYRREAHAIDCHASLESDGSALPVSYQQLGSTSLYKPQHFPEAYANGGAGREAAHKWEAHE
jgi:hypothetical protein